MFSPWQIIESGSLAPEIIMDKDAFLLSQLTANGPPLLHLYEWENPCLTYGYFTDPHCYLHLEALEACGLQMARRPTGGGIIFHLTDLAFSVLIPAGHPLFSLNTLENYAWINNKVAESIRHWAKQSLQPYLLALEPSHLNNNCDAFCMAKPTRYDLILEGKKVGGAAQRRTRDGLLHQGTLSLLFPPVELLSKILKNHESILMAMRENSYCLLPEKTTTQELQEGREDLKEILKIFFKTV
jgi:lipoate---protein ligase